MSTKWFFYTGIIMLMLYFSFTFYSEQSTNPVKLKSAAEKSLHRPVSRPDIGTIPDTETLPTTGVKNSFVSSIENSVTNESRRESYSNFDQIAVEPENQLESTGMSNADYQSEKELIEFEISEMHRYKKELEFELDTMVERFLTLGGYQDSSNQYTFDKYEWLTSEDQQELEDLQMRITAQLGLIDLKKQMIIDNNLALKQLEPDR